MRRIVGALMLLGMLVPASAHADEIIVLRQFSADLGSNGLDVIGVTPFDPALGTLDKVLVTIAGTLSGSAGRFEFVPGPGGSVEAIPIPFSLQVSQVFSGEFNKYFATDDYFPEKFTFFGVGTTGFAENFSYTYEFSHISDILGIGGLGPSSVNSSGNMSFTPPPTMAGDLSSFIKAIGPDGIDLVQTYLYTDNRLTLTALSTIGTIEMDYYYTATPPTPPDPSTSVPEPSSALLLGLGIGGAVMGRRRLATHRNAN